MSRRRVNTFPSSGTRAGVNHYFSADQGQVPDENILKKRSDIMQKPVTLDFSGGGKLLFYTMPQRDSIGKPVQFQKQYIIWPFFLGKDFFKLPKLFIKSGAQTVEFHG